MYRVRARSWCVVFVQKTLTVPRSNAGYYTGISSFLHPNNKYTDPTATTDIALSDRINRSC